MFKADETSHACSVCVCGREREGERRGGERERRLDREAAAVLSPPPQPFPPPPPPLSFAPLALLQSLGWGIGPLYRSLILKVIKSWAVGLFCSVTNGLTKSHHPRPASLTFGILRGITTSQNFLALFCPQTSSSYITFIHFPLFFRFVEKYGSHASICHIPAYQRHWINSQLCLMVTFVYFNLHLSNVEQTENQECFHMLTSPPPFIFSKPWTTCMSWKVT